MKLEKHKYVHIDYKSMRGKYWFDLDIPYKHFWIDNALGQLILISSPGVKQFA